ncbi:predicted protein [Histoplasma capsulatum G186AR]|uniref:Uncharacterized protein n=1 Tax=Ajellomyces capsulatus (strain G186AR / H82 / ATCC MYA-2454 / RMSCC 2432) TaxID=447093 RepID=C0NDD5_AJECG|nr:uncharacterized protein HCBG_01131 [Histoplasma capsulatum G186AR]EEH11676.1 predicted protein [Histoplasma capsulatum G186AR]
MPEQEGFGKQSKHRISPLWLKKYFNLDKQAQDGQQRHRSRPESDNLAAKGEARYVYAEVWNSSTSRLPTNQHAYTISLVVLISSNPPIHPPIRSSSPLIPLALHFRKLQPSSAAWRTSPFTTTTTAKADDAERPRPRSRMATEATLSSPTRLLTPASHATTSKLYQQLHQQLLLLPQGKNLHPPQ